MTVSWLLTQYKPALVPDQELSGRLDRLKARCFNQFRQILSPEAIWVNLAEADKEGVESIKLLH